MTAKRIFITGASGCIGHYLTEALIQRTDHELFLLVRDPAKLRFDLQTRDGVHLLKGSMQQIGDHAELLKTMDVAVLTATSWGGVDEVYEVNVQRTLELIGYLDPQRCEQVLYFSTESILNQRNQLLPEAYELGTDYIRSKYLCLQALGELAIAPRITALFPSLVFGGDAQKPYSHLTSGLPEVMRWLWLIRFFDIDASFHFIHAYDIAQVVAYLVDQPLPPEACDATPSDPVAPVGTPILRQVVLGNEAITANQAIAQACEYFSYRRGLRVSVSFWLVELLIKLFRIQVGSWDRFCMRYRHFVHQNPIHPGRFGLPTYGATLGDLLKLSGIFPPRVERERRSPG